MEDPNLRRWVFQRDGCRVVPQDFLPPLMSRSSTLESAWGPARMKTRDDARNELQSGH
jgi:hypothetical protein